VRLHARGRGAGDVPGVQGGEEGVLQGGVGEEL
jgi:hypothetical protein